MMYALVERECGCGCASLTDGILAPRLAQTPGCLPKLKRNSNQKSSYWTCLLEEDAQVVILGTTQSHINYNRRQ